MDRESFAMVKKQFDTEALIVVIMKCFEYGMDGSIPLSDRQKFINEGKRLRGVLVNLLSMWFDTSAQAYAEASLKLKDVSDRLEDRIETLKDVVGSVSMLAELVKVLDKLLEIAASVL
jgi:hypothetical protein